MGLGYLWGPTAGDVGVHGGVPGLETLWGWGTSGAQQLGMSGYMGGGCPRAGDAVGMEIRAGSQGCRVVWAGGDARDGQGSLLTCRPW